MKSSIQKTLSQLCSSVFLISISTVINTKTSSVFITLLQNLQLEVLDQFPECSLVDLILESNSQFSLADNWLRAPIIKQGASIIPNLNQLNVSIKEGPELQFVIKFNSVCSIVAYNVDYFLQLSDSELDEFGRFRNWQANFEEAVPHLPSTFVIYFTLESNFIESKLVSFSKLTAFIEHYVFVIQDTFESFTVLKSYPLDYHLVIKGTFNNASKSLTQKIFSSKLKDLQGQPFGVIVCPMCDSAVEQFQQSGLWDDILVAPVFEMVQKFNITLELEPVVGIPFPDLKEDGELDELTQPLLDGSIAMSTLIKPSPLKFRLILLTIPVIYDSVIFITGPPRRVKSGAVSVLYEPLDGTVWLAFVVTWFSTFVVLSLIIYFRRRQVIPMTVSKVLLYPILEQVSSDAQRLQSQGRDFLIDSLIVLWLLSLIVLGCGYKSKLISAIVIPNFIKPPGTFDELVNSNFSINAVFYAGNVETELASSNNSMSRNIMSRVVEFDYVEPECYQLIFEGNNVCLGYNAVMNGLGIDKLVDIHRRKMWSVSKDSHFSMFMQLGISKFYPMFLKPLNFIMQVHDDMGFKVFYWDLSQRKRLKEGQQNALKAVETKKYYQGLEETDAKEESRQFAELIAKIFTFGILLSLLTAALESLKMLCKRSGNEVNSVTNFSEEI
ncbi:unnamed protein product [Allacma fusca]|uniref:Ionotropic receptor n=1 Tax=Allacma fusca TaxID=39272 RepID=A0A8J2P1W6_9HEXA|nr:unnamed protein product [Allacma fusca]